MRMRSDKLRDLSGDAGDVGNHNLAPVRVGGARDGTVFFKVNGRPVERIGRGDRPPLGPRMSEVRWQSDKVGGDEGARDAGFPNSEPGERAGRRKDEGRARNRVRKIRRNKNSRKNKEEDRNQEALKTGGGVGPTIVHPGRSGVRSLTDAASRMRAVVTSVSGESDLMDGENPFIPKRGTTATLGKPSSMNPGSFIKLAGGSNESTVKGVLTVNDTNGYIETMGVTKKADKILDRSEITEGKSVSDPRGDEFATIAPSAEEHGSIGLLGTVESE
jgi:hypothetical protein